MKITGNKISHVPSLSQDKFKNIKVLSLAENNISSVPADIFSGSLQVLEMHKNNISRLDDSFVESIEINFTSFYNCTFYENPWICDCNATKFINLIQKLSLLNINNEKKIQCKDKKFMYQLNLKKLCPDTHPDLLESLNNFKKKILIIVGIGILFLVIVLGLILWCCRKYYIKFLLYNKSWCCFCLSGRHKLRCFC